MMKSLSALDLGSQYVCKTEKACNGLEIVSEKTLGSFELEMLSDKGFQRREEAIVRTEEVLVKYRREGKFFDEILRGM